MSRLCVAPSKDALDSLGVLAELAADLPIGFARSVHCFHTLERRLLIGVRAKPPTGHAEAERPLAASVNALSSQMALHVPDALADAVALVLRDRRQDREHELGNAIAAHVAAKIDHVEA